MFTFFISTVTGIIKEHCTFTTNGDQVSVTPLGSAKLFVNGSKIDKATVLKHGNRMVFGNNQTYLFHLPSVAKTFSEKQKSEVESYDWEFVQRELNETQMQKFTEGERVAREKAENAAKAMQQKVKELEERMASEQKRTHKEVCMNEYVRGCIDMCMCMCMHVLFVSC